MTPRSISVSPRTGVLVSNPRIPPSRMILLIPKGAGRSLFFLWIAGFVAAVALLCGCHRAPRTFEQNYSDGLKLMEQGKFEAAQGRFGQASRQNPENIEAQYQLAVADLKLHNDVDAYPLLRKAEQQDRNSPVSLKIRLELAKLYLAAKEYGQAQKRLVWILSGDPGDKAARGLLATALAGQAHPEEATIELDRLLAADPANLQGRVMLAAIDLGARNGAAAEKVLLDGVQLSKRSVESDRK